MEVEQAASENGSKDNVVISLLTQEQVEDQPVGVSQQIPTHHSLVSGHSEQAESMETEHSPEQKGALTAPVEATEKRTMQEEPMEIEQPPNHTTPQQEAVPTEQEKPIPVQQAEEKEEVIEEMKIHFPVGESLMRNMELPQLRAMLNELRNMGRDETVDGIKVETTHEGMLKHLEELLPQLKNIHASMSFEDVKKAYMVAMEQYNKGILARRYMTRTVEPQKEMRFKSAQVKEQASQPQQQQRFEGVKKEEGAEIVDQNLPEVQVNEGNKETEKEGTEMYQTAEKHDKAVQESQKVINEIVISSGEEDQQVSDQKEPALRPKSVGKAVNDAANTQEVQEKTLKQRIELPVSNSDKPEEKKPSPEQISLPSGLSQAQEAKPVEIAVPDEPAATSFKPVEISVTPSPPKKATVQLASVSEQKPQQKSSGANPSQPQQKQGIKRTHQEMMAENPPEQAQPRPVEQQTRVAELRRTFVEACPQMRSKIDKMSDEQVQMLERKVQSMKAAPAEHSKKELYYQASKNQETWINEINWKKGGRTSQTFTLGHERTEVVDRKKNPTKGGTSLDDQKRLVAILTKIGNYLQSS